MSTPKRTRLQARLALLAILTMISVLASCGSDDSESDAATDVSDESSGDTATDDADEGLVTAESADEEQASDAAMDDAATMAESDAAEGSSARTSVGGVDAAADGAAPANGGFFAPSEPEAPDTEANFADYGIRPFVETTRDPLSTFALDVDTGAYTVGRQWLESGQLPPRESVRVEEYVNSFDYDYPAPREGLTVVADGGPSPFDRDNVILRLGVQAEQVSNAERPDAALTFVVDTSGSMDRPNRLGLVKDALAGLTRELSDDDTVAIVTYSDAGQVVLPPTEVRDRNEILDAIDRLRPDGSTNLEAGLAVGYELANEQYRRGGVNRVILASDGIANVGLTDPDGLSRMIRDDADEGIQLVTIGVGMDDFNDVMMEQLADQGDGFYSYVDDLGEAERLFSDELVSTLVTVAIDGKIQVEFNPETVEQYRLIGFENRAVLDDDFRNDSVDAGELGAGHQVTAIYELTLRSGASGRDRLGTAQLRWEDPDERSVRESRLELMVNTLEDRWSDTSDDFRLAVTVASFAEILRDSPYRGDVSFSQVQAEADALSGRSGQVAEFVGLVERARRLS
ncbi:MAG: VWA domain-containing protein [Acidimicrobiia bacterium]|nr:VWA domain-containing protein [Acidimicrobiia bacterium]